MAISFYAGSGSPFSWRVWLTLEHKHLAYDLKMLSFQAGDHKHPDYLALNPRGRVPTIVDHRPDGEFVLFESSAIIRYLEEAYPDHPLLPHTLRERALVNRLWAEVDHYITEANERLVNAVLFTPEPQWNAADIAEAQKDLLEELARFEGYLAGGDFLAGELSAADFALYPVLALALRVEAKKKPDLGLAAAMGPNLVAWKARIEALPYYEKTYPPHWRQ